MFVHKSDFFWRTTTKNGINIELQTTTQLQILWDEIKNLQEVESNECSLESHDECFESNLASALKKQVDCRPSFIDLKNLTVCDDPQQLRTGEKIVKRLIKTMDTICRKQCHFLKLRTGARNFNVESTNLTRWYGYFSYKVPVRYEKGILQAFKKSYKKSA